MSGPEAPSRVDNGSNPNKRFSLIAAIWYLSAFLVAGLALVVWLSFYILSLLFGRFSVINGDASQSVSAELLQGVAVGILGLLVISLTMVYLLRKVGGNPPWLFRQTAVSDTTQFRVPLFLLLLLCLYLVWFGAGMYFASAQTNPPTDGICDYDDTEAYARLYESSVLGKNNPKETNLNEFCLDHLMIFAYFNPMSVLTTPFASEGKRDLMIHDRSVKEYASVFLGLWILQGLLAFLVSVRYSSWSPSKPVFIRIENVHEVISILIRGLFSWVLISGIMVIILQGLSSTTRASHHNAAWSNFWTIVFLSYPFIWASFAVLMDTRPKGSEECAVHGAQEMPMSDQQELL